MTTVVSLMTAVYMFRLVFLTFHGERRHDAPTPAHPEEDDPDAKRQRQEEVLVPLPLAGEKQVEEDVADSTNIVPYVALAAAVVVLAGGVALTR